MPRGRVSGCSADPGRLLPTSVGFLGGGPAALGLIDQVKCERRDEHAGTERHDRGNNPLWHLDEPADRGANNQGAPGRETPQGRLDPQGRHLNLARRVAAVSRRHTEKTVHGGFTTVRP